MSNKTANTAAGMAPASITTLMINTVCQHPNLKQEIPTKKIFLILFAQEFFGHGGVVIAS